jgi:hypothetical protein
MGRAPVCTQREQGEMIWDDLVFLLVRLTDLGCGGGVLAKVCKILRVLENMSSWFGNTLGQGTLMGQRTERRWSCPM